MDLIWSLLTLAGLGWASLIQRTVQHSDVLIPIGVGLTTGFVLIRTYDWGRRIWREKRMSAYARKMREGRRKKFLDSLLADIVVDGLEAAEHRRVISGSEKKYLYWRARQALKLPDLYPGMPLRVWFTLLKKMIKARMGDKAKLPLPSDDKSNWVGDYSKSSLDDLLDRKAA